MTKKYKNTISKYISAKDNNKAFLMNEAFSKTSKLKMKLKSENISFPDEIKGLDEITKVLVSRFNKTYENIHTVCLEDSIVCKDNKLDCNWLVVMSGKESSNLRFGFGSYSWTFNKKNKVKNLNIIIEKMEVFDEKYSNDFLSWVSNLEYPFTSRKATLKSFPELKELKSIKKDFKDFI